MVALVGLGATDVANYGRYLQLWLKLPNAPLPGNNRQKAVVSCVHSYSHEALVVFVGTFCTLDCGKVHCNSLQARRSASPPPQQALVMRASGRLEIGKGVQLHVKQSQKFLHSTAAHIRLRIRPRARRALQLKVQNGPTKHITPSSLYIKHCGQLLKTSASVPFVHFCEVWFRGTT